MLMKVELHMGDRRPLFQGVIVVMLCSIRHEVSIDIHVKIVCYSAFLLRYLPRCPVSTSISHTIQAALPMKE